MTLWPCPLCKTLTAGVYCAACEQKARDLVEAKKDPKKLN